MDSRKITFFISSLAGGGAERVCVNIANGLVERGWSVTLVVLHLERAAYKSELNHNVNLISLDVKNARYSFYKLYKYIKINKISRVVVFNYELTVILVLIRSIFQLDFNLIARNINSISEKMKHNQGTLRHKVLYFLMQKVYKKADHIINQCHSMQNDLLMTFPEVKGKCSVIYNPINPYLAQQSSEEFKIESDYLLCVGRLEKQKAFHFAIEAFSLIVTHHPNLRLKIIGQGSLESDLKKMCKNLKVENQVDFEGFHSNITPYYSNAKATLLTSLYEGFPNVLVESISMGIPVISFDCKSGPSEIIVDGENGFLVEFKSVDGIFHAVDNLLNNGIDVNKVFQSSVRFKGSAIIDEWEKIINAY